MPRAAPRAEIACVARLLLRCGLQWRCRHGIVRRASEHQGNRQQDATDPRHHESLLQKSVPLPSTGLWGHFPKPA
jgi:hypothetical protein